MPNQGSPGQPALCAGDALICAGSLARGLWPWRAPTPQLLLGATFASNRAFPTAGYDVPPDAPPAWLDELTPVRQRLKPGREQGTGRDKCLATGAAFGRDGSVHRRGRHRPRPG